MQFHWRAYYGDEYVGEKDVTYDKIDRAKLTAFSLISNKHGTPEIILYINPTQKLFYRMRTTWKPFAEPPVNERLWLLGSRELLGDTVIMRIVFAHEDGTIEIFDKFQKCEPYTSPDFSVEEQL